MCFVCGADGKSINEPQPRPAAPPKFDDVYTLEKKLGEGGFAVVKLAKRKTDGELFAVKISKPSRTTELDLAALKEEYSIVKSLSHRNIVEAYELYEDAQTVPPTLNVVMEFIQGGELFHRIVKKTQYTEKEARDTALRLLRAIEHIHEHDIVHRDLKPENLLLKSPDDDTALKVADFGLAKRAAGDTIIDKSGTPSYVSPEMIMGTPYGKGADMWACGVIIFILIGGYPPFQGDNLKTLFRKISQARFTFHPQRWSTVSQGAKDLISSLLTVDTSKRLTAQQAMQHTWIHAPAETLSTSSLEATLNSLRTFNAARTLKAAVRTVIFTNRVARLVRKETLSRELYSRLASRAASRRSQFEVGSSCHSLHSSSHSITVGKSADARDALTADADADADLDAGVASASQRYPSAPTASNTSEIDQSNATTVSTGRATSTTTTPHSNETNAAKSEVKEDGVSPAKLDEVAPEDVEDSYCDSDDEEDKELEAIAAQLDAIEQEEDAEEAAEAIVSAGGSSPAAHAGDTIKRRALLEVDDLESSTGMLPVIEPLLLPADDGEDDDDDDAEGGLGGGYNSFCRSLSRIRAGSDDAGVPTGHSNTGAGAGVDISSPAGGARATSILPRKGSWVQLVHTAHSGGSGGGNSRSRFSPQRHHNRSAGSAGSAGSAAASLEQTPQSLPGSLTPVQEESDSGRSGPSASGPSGRLEGSGQGVSLHLGNSVNCADDDDATTKVGAHKMGAGSNLPLPPSEQSPAPGAPAAASPETPGTFGVLDGSSSAFVTAQTGTFAGKTTSGATGGPSCR